MTDPVIAEAEEAGGHRPLGYRGSPNIRRFLSEMGHRLTEILVQGTRRAEPVVRYAKPLGFHAAFERHVGLRLRPGEPAHGPEPLMQAVEDILSRSVHSGHPRFFNQNWAGADPVSVLGDWLTALLNTTAATYEMAPIFTLMENEILARMAELAGFAAPGAGPHVQAGAHGLFTPGGATSNLYALHLARAWAAPEVLEDGWASGPRLVAFTSEQSHYSLVKAAAMIGLGRKGLVEVACDEWGRMRVDALRDAISEARASGARPFFINATAATTVMGAFDPIAQMAELASEEGLWLHVDGAVGGSALFSPRHRSLLSGVEHARSFAWNPHKMMGMTQQCSVLLVRDPELLRGAFAANANYIFQADKNDADLDLGDLTLQCGRRPDGVKLWLTWKARGEGWFGERVDRAVSLAERLESILRKDHRFQLVHPRPFVNVGFWWVPPDLRPLQTEKMSPSVWARLHALAPRIKDRLQREGSALLGFQPLGALPNFFRLLIMSPDVTEQDLLDTLDIIDRFGQLCWSDISQAGSQ